MDGSVLVRRREIVLFKIRGGIERSHGFGSSDFVHGARNLVKSSRGVFAYNNFGSFAFSNREGKRRRLIVLNVIGSGPGEACLFTIWWGPVGNRE